ncbi:MAG: hypothetical protein ACRECR_06095 [Thermoplasmata archaeon]
MRRFAHRDIPGVAADAAIAFNLWEELSDRATCRAWIESHRVTPSALSIQRREQGARKAAALEQTILEQGVAQGSARAFVEARRTVSRAFRSAHLSRMRLAIDFEDRAALMRGSALWSTVEVLVAGAGFFGFAWFVSSPDLAWTYILGIPAVAFLEAFFVVKLGFEAVVATLLGSEAHSRWRAWRLREVDDEHRRLSRRLTTMIGGGSGSTR